MLLISPICRNRVPAIEPANEIFPFKKNTKRVKNPKEKTLNQLILNSYFIIENFSTTTH